MEWQTIESAPLDGSPVIVGLFKKTNGVIHYFWMPITAHFEEQEWRRSEDYGVEPLGAQPTHWMPLPSPPTALDTQRREG